MFHLSKINSYKPIVSDVSDDDLMQTVKQIEKSENVISPTPKLTRGMLYDIFKSTRGQQSCLTRKSVKAPNIHQFNPIRSTGAMTELSKKRWVSPICAVLIFSYDTPLPSKETCFVCLPFAMKQIFINFPASKSLQRPRSSGLLVHTTGGGPSGQKFSIKDTLPKLHTTTGKSNQLIPVQRTWMSCKLICVISL